MREILTAVYHVIHRTADNDPGVVRIYLQLNGLWQRDMKRFAQEHNALPSEKINQHRVASYGNDTKTLIHTHTH